MKIAFLKAGKVTKNHSLFLTLTQSCKILEDFAYRFGEEPGDTICKVLKSLRRF